MTFPADTYSDAVDLSITASNQLHKILNGDSTTEITVEDGSKIPSVRKAYTDSLFFLSPQPWTVGEYETVYNQLRAFVEPTGITTWWFSKTATVSTPILMSTTPHEDSNWTLWNAINNSVYETQKRLAAEAGLNMVGSFLLGATATTTDDVVFYETDGKYYAWGGDLPKVVPAGSTPSTVGGVGAGAWSDKTGLTLRSDLNIVVKVFDVLADLDADASLVVGQKCRILGRYAIGDGGANDYEVVAAATGTDDGGSYIDLTASGLQLYAVNNNGRYRPEQWGCKHDGVTSMHSEWNKFMSAIPSGSVIELYPAGVYYNENEKNTVADYKVEFSADDLTVFANNATFKRAETISTGIESSVLEFTGDNITVIGTLNVDGGEPIGILKNNDASRTNLGTNSYALTQGIRHGVKVTNCTGLETTDRIKIKNTTFGAYFKNTSNFSVKMKSDYSGQVVPNIVTGGEPALGAGVKLSGCSDFDIDITGDNNTNALVECEPVGGDATNARGRIKARGKTTVASAITIGNSEDIKFDVYCNSDQYFSSAGLVRCINGVRRCRGVCESPGAEKTLLFMYNMRGSSASNDNNIEVKSITVTSRPVYIESAAGGGAISDNVIDVHGLITNTGTFDAITIINSYNNTISGSVKRETTSGTCVTVSGATTVNNRLVDLDIEGNSTDYYIAASAERPIFIHCAKGSTRRVFDSMAEYQIRAAQIRMDAIPTSSGGTLGAGYLYSNGGIITRV